MIFFLRPSHSRNLVLLSGKQIGNGKSTIFMYVCIDLRYIDVSPVELEGYPAMCRRVGKSMLMPHQELALPRSIWILALHPSEPRSAESHMSS